MSITSNLKKHLKRQPLCDPDAFFPEVNFDNALSRFGKSLL